MSINLIYKLINTANNKIYVGQTWKTLKERWDNGWGYKMCTHLHHAIVKHGKSSFHYEILTVAHTQEVADYWENYFIERCGSRNPDIGYNIRGGGSKGKFQHYEETKRKISEAKKGRPLSEKHKKKISARMTGTLNPNYGKPKTKEQLAKQSASMSGKNHPGWGKIRSIETKDKISKAQSGEKSSKAKLTVDSVIEIIRLLKLGNSQRKIALMFGVTQSAINNIHVKKSWKDIER